MNTRPKKLTSPVIGVRLTNKEYRELQKLAAYEGRPKAGVLRALLLKELRDNG